MRMIFIFIDGLGLGEMDPVKNPLVAANTPNLDYIFEHFLVLPTDTTLGVEGLPQSATGQTTIFTGVNASRVLGRHLSGQPTESLKKVINKQNMFKALIDKGFSVTNSNVYRHEYLQTMLDSKDRRQRPSVTSVMTMSSGVKFRNVNDYEEGLGVYHDITGEILKEKGYDVTLITPAEAAERLYKISRGYDFTLYEHFLTDIIGHKMDMESAIKEIQLLDTFLGHLIRLVNFHEDMVVVTSDHGNIEDIGVKTHTFNKIPTIIMGKVPEDMGIFVESLTDIMPLIIEIFEREGASRV